MIHYLPRRLKQMGSCRLHVTAWLIQNKLITMQNTQNCGKLKIFPLKFETLANSIMTSLGQFISHLVVTGC